MSTNTSEREKFEAWQSRQGWSESDLSDKCSDGAPRAGEYRNGRLQDEWEVWQAALAASQADAKDAARYRWLRETWRSPDSFLIKKTSDGNYWMRLGAMDTAIDSAIATQANAAKGEKT